MKAHSDNKAIYIRDFIKQNHNKRRFKQLMHYVSTTERQLIKLSSKYISNYNLSIMI